MRRSGFILVLVTNVLYRLASQVTSEVSGMRDWFVHGLRHRLCMVCFRPPLCLQLCPPVAPPLDSHLTPSGYLQEQDLAVTFFTSGFPPEAWNLEVSHPKGCGIPGTGSSILAECEVWGKASCWLGMGQVCRLTLKEQKYVGQVGLRVHGPSREAGVLCLLGKQYTCCVHSGVWEVWADISQAPVICQMPAKHFQKCPI